MVFISKKNLHCKDHYIIFRKSNMLYISPVFRDNQLVLSLTIKDIDHKENHSGKTHNYNGTNRQRTHKKNEP